MTSQYTIRCVEMDDAEALVEIYRPYVESTAVSFEMQVPSAQEFADRISTVLTKWSWLVAELDGQPIGYAYGSAHRAREAYAYSVETSAYVNDAHHGRGVARSLYTELFVRLRELGFANAYAGATLPNDASVGFHKSFGFTPIGVFPKVGFKFNQWHDVAWFHRPIQVDDEGASE